MSIAIAPMLGAMAAMIALLLLPQLDAAREPNVWWAPVALVLGATTLIGVGLSTAAPSAERPVPTTLLFAFDHDSQEAFWAAPEGASLEWAESRVGTLEGEGSLDRFLAVGPGGYLTTPAATPTMTSPRAVFLSESVEMGRRRVRLALRSEVGAERLDLQVEGDGGIVTINGHPVPDSATARLNHWGIPPAGWLVLELEQPAPGAPATIRVTEVHHRPSELIGGDFFRRPPELTPDVTTLTDVALIRSTIAIAPPGQVAVDPSAAEIEALHAGGAARDSASAPPSGETSQADTTVASPAPVASPDTAMVDTTTVAPDSTAAPVDTTRTGPLTAGSPPDTADASRDTLVSSGAEVRRD
jgi:hypothetical protein